MPKPNAVDPWAVRCVQTLRSARVVLDAAVRLVERVSMLTLAVLALRALIAHSMP